MGDSVSAEVNYGMVSLYALLIVIIIVVILWTGWPEGFNQPQTRSDLSGDWDIKTALARIAAQQERLLSAVLRSKQ